MAEDLQETYLRQLLETHAEAPEVVVAWQGGEPTMMGLDFFRRSIELERRYARPGQRMLNTLQTNGTLLDDAWGAFLRENLVLVGITIDGPRQMHDTYRVDKGGKPTFDRVLRGLDGLERHGVDWNVLTTVNAADGDHGEAVYRFLRDQLGATFRTLLELVALPGQGAFGQDKRDTLTTSASLQRRLPEGPVRHPPTASPASTTCAPATRSSSTTSGRRWTP